jgi:TonB family protein
MLQCMSTHPSIAKEQAMHTESNSTNVYSALLVCILAAASVTLAGCGGTAMLRESQPLESSGTVAEAKDERVLASIDAVILRNGTGAWARDAEWDEYLIRIHSLSDEPVEVREIAIFDALDYRIEARADRGALVDGTREIERRYAQSGKLVKASGGNGWVVGAGVVGVAGLASAAAYSAAPSFAGVAAAGAAITVVAGAGVVFAGTGLVRMVNNAEVNREIKRRQTALPVPVPRGAGTSIDLFFPLTPLSGRTQVIYVDRHGEHRLDIDTRQALMDLELKLDPPPTVITRHDPKFPGDAHRAGIEHGYVTARLTLDRQGRVQAVDITESVPLGVFTHEARRTFSLWTFSAGRADDRTVEATLEFKR